MTGMFDPASQSLADVPRICSDSEGGALISLDGINTNLVGIIHNQLNRLQKPIAHFLVVRHTQCSQAQRKGARVSVSGWFIATGQRWQGDRRWPCGL